MAGFYWHGISGNANRADMLDDRFAADPAASIAAGIAEAESLGLRYMIAFPCGYNRATAGVQPDGSRYLINSNTSLAMMPTVFAAIANNPKVTACNLGWHAASNWRTEPHRIDMMPTDTGARALSASDRRKWVRLHLSPLQAASNIRHWAFDGSEKDIAGVAVAEAELRRDEVADCYVELPPTLPGPNGTLVLDTAKMLAYPTLGHIAQWDFPAKYRLHHTPVPAGIECHLVCLPDWGPTPNFALPPINFPNLREIGIAKFNRYEIGVGSGWPSDMARRIREAPAVNPATD